MKHKIFSLMMLSFISLIMIHCDKDDSEYILEAKQEFIVEKVYFNELSQNNKLSKKLESIRESKSIYSRTNNDSLIDFTVNENIANYVEYSNGKHSYSFSIDRLYQTNSLENLILISNEVNEYDAYIVDYNISKEEYENIDSVLELTSTINYYPIDYDNEFLRTEQYDCSWEVVHVWVFNDVTFYIMELSCSPSGGGSTSGTGSTSNDNTTDNDSPDNFNDGVNNDSSGGGTVDFNNPGGSFTVPIVTRDHAQEIIDCLSNLDFDMELWLQNPNNFFNVRDLNVFLDKNGCGESTQDLGNLLIEIMMLDTSLGYKEALEIAFVANPEVFEDFYYYSPPENNDEIIDMEEFLDCIDPSQNAQLTIYADQPTSGSSFPTNENLDPGHAFVSLTQGENTVVFGFYPKQKVKAFLGADGSIHNNQEDEYDVSLTMDISASILNDIIHFTSDIPTTYDLNNYNCTDYVIDISNFTSNGLPNCWALYPGGGGSSPSVLGEFIRNLPESSEYSISTETSNALAQSGACN